eukprot:TRINITY_DN2745_c0_g1_i5.p1 TRINITY_DN2745_c0_g1~~TRINITY_DN2745_c0_g1_i5.p1  ORF type:complete len:699 (+),score=206.55 TRINITY_DN2745_c0_g1_i5:61-2157(+)
MSVPAIFPPASGSCGKGPGVVLDAERKNASFDIESLSNYVYGPQYLKRQKEIRQLLENDPIFRKWDVPYMNHPDRYDRCLEKIHRIYSHYLPSGLIKYNDILDRELVGQVVDEMMPIGLHFGGFIPPIEAMGTEEQKQKWLPLCRQMKIIGTYVQTELGHGSAVRSLETTAVFDPATDEFILHSPTLTATKFWPGGLARTVTHCLVMAQLIVKGKNYGPHTFIVQLRSLKDHSLMPNVITGDIGPKYGFDSIDNGFCRFDNVRIPRDYMLMRFAEVSRDGTYTLKGNQKLMYASMVFLRVWIVESAAIHLARAATIAIRYSAVRRQFSRTGADGKELAEEEQILNYQNQQHALLPQLAITYAVHFTGKWVRSKYEEFRGQLAQGNTSGLAEIHIMSSGLKAFTTAIINEGLEICRRSCGGHGYSKYSGFVEVIKNYVPSQTYEGENNLMMLQVARYLTKNLGKIAKGQPLPPSLQYLGETVPAIMGGEAQANVKSAADMINAEFFLRAFQFRASHLILSVAQKMRAQNKGYKKGAAATVPGPRPLSMEEAWQANVVDLLRAAQAHCGVLVLTAFSEAVNAAPAPALKQVLRNLLNLFAMYMMERDLGDYLEGGFFNPKQAGWVRHNARALLAPVRRDAVPLVDAFAFSDHYLNSALGRYDGNVYEALMEWTSRDPSNIQPVPTPAQKKYLLPIIQSKL